MTFKKIFLFIIALFTVITVNSAFADEITFSDGSAEPCKIEKIKNNIVKYRHNGKVISFERGYPYFNDYIIVKSSVFDKKEALKFYGQVTDKNLCKTRIVNSKEEFQTATYRIKFISIFRLEESKDGN